MPTPLTRSTADSFNSAATIVPDDRRPTRLTRSSARNNPPDHTLSLSQSSSQGSASHLSAGRQLAPANSFERRINKDLGVHGGDDGMIGLLQTQDVPDGSGWSFLRDQSQSQKTEQDDMALDPRSSPPPAFDPTILSHEQRHPGYRQTSYSTASVASSCDNSDLYSTTDIDTDDESSRRPSISHMGDLGLGDISLDHNALLSALPSPAAEMRSPLGYRAAVSPQDIHRDSPVAGYHSPEATDLPQMPRILSGPTRTGKRALRGKAAKDDEITQAERLEHRRDINRRSAQKHRARRKEESEIMAKLVASKDARIRQLEHELAAEKARTEQLRSMWNQRFANNGPGI